MRYSVSHIILVSYMCYNGALLAECFCFISLVYKHARITLKWIRAYMKINIKRVRLYPLGGDHCLLICIHIYAAYVRYTFLDASKEKLTRAYNTKYIICKRNRTPRRAHVTQTDFLNYQNNFFVLPARPLI